MIIRALDDNWDIYFENGRSAHLEDSLKITQSIKSRLWLFLEEWFLDETDGVPWYQSIFVKPVNISQVELIIKNRILQTEGVVDLQSFEMNYTQLLTSNPRRTLAINFSYTDVYGGINQVNM